MTEDEPPTRIAVPCRRCGGWLVSPDSVHARIGPVCAQRDRADARRTAEEIPLFELEGVSACP